MVYLLGNQIWRAGKSTRKWRVFWRENDLHPIWIATKRTISHRYLLIFVWGMLGFFNQRPTSTERQLLQTLHSVLNAWNIRNMAGKKNMFNWKRGASPRSKKKNSWGYPCNVSWPSSKICRTPLPTIWIWIKSKSSVLRTNPELDMARIVVKQSHPVSSIQSLPFNVELVSVQWLHIVASLCMTCFHKFLASFYLTNIHSANPTLQWKISL